MEGRATDHKIKVKRQRLYKYTYKISELNRFKVRRRLCVNTCQEQGLQ